MKRWKWVLLIFELILVAVILILPQVNLPDFAFHGGNAPIAAKARTSSRPTTMPAVVTAIVNPPALMLESRAEQAGPLASNESAGRLSLLCTLIC